MWLFRKTLDLGRAAPRPLVDADLTAVSRLLRDAGRRFYGRSGAQLPALLSAGGGIALDAGGELYAVAIAGLPVDATCWLRAVALAEGVEARATLATLMPALHDLLCARGIASLYYEGDESADTWLAPALRSLGYDAETEVVVYEKQNLVIPDGGSDVVDVRPVQPGDLAAVLRIDTACFEPQWTKDDVVLGAAVEQGPYFVVAELDGAAVGYAYATSHFGGRLVHLVRIAVDPAHRGERIGVRLLADVVAYAERVGANAVTLNTQAYNTGAQRLYRWFGFAPTGERQHVLRRSLRP